MPYGGTRRCLATLLLVLGLAGCDSSSPTPAADGAVDTGTSDRGSGETSTGDAGVVDAGSGGDSGALSCATQCHGSATNAAPPLSLKGATATSARGVGAHQAHLKSSTWHVEVKCSDCHLVPAQVTDTGHIDTTLPAEVSFSAAAKADGAQPTWSGTTCSGTYCHGATLSGGTSTAPTWTKVDGTQVKCGGCHGLPPTKNHTTSTKCATCHKGVVDAANKIIAPQLHIDGKVTATGGHPAGYKTGSVHGGDFYKDPKGCTACHGTSYSGGSAKSCETCHPGWQSKCTFCHGGTNNQTGAPPESVDNKTATTLRGVGAHTAHLKTTSTHVAFACSSCHKVPGSLFAVGHIDTALPAEVTFGGLSGADGAKPGWSKTALTCSGSYCHGATLSGGTLTTPKWTKVDGTQGACGTCHGLPPTSGHSSSKQCSLCHSAVVDAANKIKAPALHVDGKVSVNSPHPTGYSAGSVHGPAFNKNPNSCKACHGSALTGGSAKSCETCHSGWKTNCTFCHGGTLNKTGAPPETVDGKTAVSVPGVGRHTSHVTAGASHGAYGCGLCHKVPASALSAGHIDPAPAEVTFTGVASGASYNFSTYWCTNVYCHGNGKSGAGGSALWTGSLSGGCSACHDDETKGSNMTLSKEHKKHIIDKNIKCSTCHACVVSATKTITDKSKHINGQHEVCGTNLNWNPTSKSCNPACHGSETWF